MTGSIRLFTTQALASDLNIQATPEQAHYLANVMRRGVGDIVVLFNGVDGEFNAEITAIKRDRAVFALRDKLRPQLALPSMTLIFAPLKRDTTTFVIEKATELGVTHIRPVFTDRTQAGRVNLDRFHATAREAAEQCERLCVPLIDEPVRLFDLLGAWPHDRLLFAAIERADAKRPEFRPNPAALLVGPEGGFTQTELDAMRRLSFVKPISLGPLILRAETAVIAGLALVQACESR